ncbi:Hypothetical protein R9X50_00052300 [Acrodontium crateriforme]|uniref:Uncharacterized protein n=1 Tax=Acrodontium crateriforme TaxID=150365 RepID=A0AAQ3M0F5_9PEZI|nr:Hypothetical protein R9X50_00052300 [Acrodontium crateriforme]
MSLGRLTARIFLTDGNKIHYGSNDPVTGHVAVRYSGASIFGQTNAERGHLFGPLRIRMSLIGSLKILFRTSGTLSDDYKSCKTILNASETAVHDGSFQILDGETLEFPFALTFPTHLPQSELTRPKTHVDENGGRRVIHGREQTQADELPPSFKILNTSTSGATRREMSIEYILELAVDMPGIPIDILIGPYKSRIQYERPKIKELPQANDNYLSSQVNIISDKLGTKVEERGGFANRAKLFFTPSEDKQLRFEIYCTSIPDEVYLGQILTFQIGIKINREKSTVDVVPEIIISAFNVRVIAYTRIEAGKQITPKEKPTDVHVAKTLAGEVSPPGPFTKETDYTKMARTTEPISDIPSSFSMSDLTRFYKLRVEIEVSVGGQSRNARSDFPVVVHPPLDPHRQSNGSNAAGPSHPVDYHEQLPAYADVIADGAPPQLADDEPAYINGVGTFETR